MKIWDTFLFRDELDMLECRLVEFDTWPDVQHILVEAAVDHQGHEKPLVYAENRERFAPWADCITHVVAEDLNDLAGADPMYREGVQREAIRLGLADAAADDWLILADVDEIPNGEALRYIRDRQTGVLAMTCCIFAVDWTWGQPLRTSPILPAGSVTSFMHERRTGCASGTPFEGTGHHLTWMGGQEGIAAKVNSHCHVELNGEVSALNDSNALYGEGQNPFGRYGYSGALIPVDIDETWPRWVYQRRCPPDWFRPRLGLPREILGDWRCRVHRQCPGETACRGRASRGGPG